MPDNARRTRVDANDDTRLWNKLQTIEDTAALVAKEHGFATISNVSVGHDSGDFVRETVTEAKTVTGRNGFEPDEVRLTIDRVVGTYFNDTPRTEPWVHAQPIRNNAGRNLVVWVRGENEVEVNGVFTLIENSLKQSESAVASAEKAAADAEAAPSAVEMSGPTSRLGRFLQHPYAVQILGGAGAVALVAVAAALFATLR